jgi:membrane protein YqaA with SNARE-associated domain
MNLYSVSVLVVDIIANTMIGGIVGGVIGWVLGYKNKTATRYTEA